MHTRVIYAAQYSSRVKTRFRQVRFDRFGARTLPNIHKYFAPGGAAAAMLLLVLKTTISSLSAFCTHPLLPLRSAMNGISTNVYTNPSPSAFADTKEPSRCNDAQVATTFTTDAIVDDTSMIVEAETVHEANETFAWCFTRQHDSLILVSGLLL